MLSIGLLVYIKTATLMILVGALYWQDFLLLWQKAIYAGWIPFAFIILLLVLVFVFLRRSALKSFLLLSETHSGNGIGLVLVALFLHAVGSYTSYPLLLRLCSSIIFMVGYIALMIDSRIAKMMSLPLLTLLFLVLPVEDEVSAVQNLLALVISYLGVGTVIVILLFLTVRELIHQNEVENAHCPFFQSHLPENETFCPHCGRQQLIPEPSSLKFVFVKFSALLPIVFSFVFLPDLAVFIGPDIASRLALHSCTLAEICVRFKDLFLTVVGAAIVLGFASLVRAQNEKVEKATENAFDLMNGEEALLVAISALNRTRFLGRELVDSYQQLTESEVDLGTFYERLRGLAKSELITNDYVVRNGQLVMVWKKTFP